MKVRSIFALYFNKSAEIMATLFTCNRTFLKRITLSGSMQKMSKHGREKERKKERKKEKKKKIVEVTEKATLFGSYYLLDNFEYC